MTTVEFINNNNVYRAIGGECWHASYQIVREQEDVRFVRPRVVKVRIRPGSSPDGILVQPSAHSHDVVGTGWVAGPEDLFDDRHAAMDHAIAACESLDNVTVRGLFTYRYDRPKAKKQTPPPIEVRVKQVRHDGYIVERRDPATRRWKIVAGLGVLSRWKATDTAKRIRCGLDVPGYWLMPDTGEYLMLADNCE